MTTIHMTRLSQDARDLYVGAMRAGDLIRFGRVAEWKENDGDGYQRAPEVPRMNKIATFLKNESVPLLPTSILLSHRGTPLPKREINDGVVAIDIADHEVLWIVDGQHRVGGLQIAIDKHGLERFRNFQLPVVLVEFDDVTEEAHQFQLINENMKKVNTQLARRLLAMHLEKGGAAARNQIRATRRLWEADSVEVIRALTRDPKSMWHGRIQPPNEKKSSEHIVRELSFSTSLRPILTDDVARDLGVERLTTYLRNYWEAWRRVIPDAFESPEDYVIQKTPGIFSLHLVAKYVLKLFHLRRVADPSVEDIRVVLEDAGEAADADYWRSGNQVGAAMAGSMSGFKLLADVIVESLKDNGQVI